MGGCSSSLSPIGRRKQRLSANEREPLILSSSAIKELPWTPARTRDHGVYFTKPLIDSSSPKTPAPSLATGLMRCPPHRSQTSIDGRVAPRRHPNHALLLLFQKGSGSLVIDMMVHDVAAGSVVWVPANAEYAVRNTSMSDELVWLYCFAADSATDVPVIHKNDGQAGRLRQASGV